MDESVKLIERLAREKFFGSLLLKFESGKLVLIRKEETLKPQNIVENHRGDLLEQNKF